VQAAVDTRHPRGKAARVVSHRKDSPFIQSGSVISGGGGASIIRYRRAPKCTSVSRRNVRPPPPPRRHATASPCPHGPRRRPPPGVRSGSIRTEGSSAAFPADGSRSPGPGREIDASPRPRGLTLFSAPPSPPNLMPHPPSSPVTAPITHPREEDLDR
jgi:hypothetical protein